MKLQGLVELMRSDRARNRYALSYVTLAVFRFGQFAYSQRSPLRFALVLLYRGFDLLYVRLLVGADLPSTIRCGRGLRLPHAGRGVVVHPDCVIGDWVTLYHGTTLGIRGGTDGVPTLDDGVYVGAGACVLGPVRIGRGAHIGANAVVVSDVPEGATAAAEPARLVKRS